MEFTDKEMAKLKEIQIDINDRNGAWGETSVEEVSRQLESLLDLMVGSELPHWTKRGTT